MTFLIIQTAFIGDAILVSAIIEKLQQFYPKGHKDILVRQGNESLYESHPYIRSVLVWDKKTTKYKSLAGLLRKIRAEEYDYVLNFQRFAASGFLTAFSKGKRKYGFRKNPFSGYFTRAFPHKIGNGQHETARNHQLIADYTDSRPLRPKLHPTEEQLGAVAQYKATPYYTVAPTSVWFTKQFPLENWCGLLKALPEAPVFLLGGPADHEAAEALRAQCPQAQVTNLCGKLSFLETAALMKDAQMNYVNDSAPLHIASAMNAPVRAVFLSTVPEFGFGPLSDDSQVVQTREELSCRPCGIHGHKACPKGHFKCAHTIRVEDLLK